jgi:FecR protein
MKIRSLFNSLAVFGVALAMASTAMAETKQITAKVTRLKGSARYKIGSGAWMPLKSGQTVGAGAIIETAPDSRVDLSLGEGEAPKANLTVGTMLTYQPATAQNMVRVWENSRMAIDTMTVTETGSDVVSETQLDLQAGHIFGSVKKMSAASRYEVKIPNGVAGIRGTTYDINVDGIIKVLDGSVFLNYKNSKGDSASQVIMSEQMFDARTGVLSELPIADKTGMPLTLQQLKTESIIPLSYSIDRTIINNVQNPSTPPPVVSPF